MSSLAARNRFCAITACEAAILLAACGGAEKRTARHMEKGQQYLAAGNLEKARVEFRNALQITPNDTAVRYENGLVSARLGNLREAGEFYEAAIEADPDNVAARAALGRLFLYGGQPDRALDTIGPSIEKHPDDPGLLIVRASARNSPKEYQRRPRGCRARRPARALERGRRRCPRRHLPVAEARGQGARAGRGCNQENA